MEEKGIRFTSLLGGMVELKSCYGSPQSYKNHMHHELSLGIIREGSTKVKFPSGIMAFSQGDGVIIPPGLSHRCSPEDLSHWCFDMLYINPDFYGQYLSVTEPVKLVDGSGINAFIKVFKESPDEAAIEEDLINLLLSLPKGLMTWKEGAVKAKNYGNEALKTYLETHYLEKITLKDLEAHFGCDKFSLIRSFKKSYNTTPMAYQMELKMAEAKGRLKANVPVLDVCHELGFYDQAHFTKEFQKMNGLSPGAYQKSVQE